MSVVQIGTSEGYDGREIVFDASSGTTLALSVRGTDGAVVTPTSPSLIVNASGTKLTLTPTAASGSLSVPITAANLASVNVSQPGIAIELFWSCVVAGVTDPVRFRELIWTSPARVHPPVNVTRIIAAYPELGSATCLPSGHSNWWTATGQYAWGKLRNWSALRSRSRMLWMIENSQVLADLFENWWLADTCMVQETMLDGAELWGKRAAYHMRIVDALKSDLVAYFGTAQASTWGDQAGNIERKTLEEPQSAGGHNRKRGRGKL